jgi:peptidoglycan/LPS O-acetylase OafA/YrhL
MFGNPHEKSQLTQWILLQWGYFGKLGVDVFFVLSGFVITLSLASHRIDFRFWLRFAGRRSLRLDPPYWMCIALSCALILLRRQFFDATIDVPTWRSIGAHLIYFQGLLGYQQINSVFWTLCIEFQLYLAFCAFLGLVQRFGPVQGPSRWCALATLIAFGFSLAWPVRGINENIDRITLLPFMCEFLTGSLAYWIWIKRIAPVPGLAAITILLVLGVRLDNPFVATAALTGILLSVAAVRGKLASWLSAEALQALGRISYSLYLVHVPTFFTILGLRRRVPGGDSELASWILCLVALAATFGVATAFYRLVERPALRLSRRLALVRPNGARTHEARPLEVGTP